jgi:integrase
MPKLSSGAAWEQGFRAAVRGGKPGWTVSNNRGRVMLKWRPSGSGTQQTVMLPVDWSPGGTDKALLLINRIAKLIASGQQDTLKGALAVARGGSSTMLPATDWPEVADSLRTALLSGRNELLPKTWGMNYKPFIEEALRLIAAGKANDGHTLLQQTLIKWTGKAPSRAACCIALRNLTDHAIARHHATACWRIDSASIKELRGKSAKKRKKATLSDNELLYLISGIESRNKGWGNVIRLLALFGLRPIELQHLTPNIKEDGQLGLLCTYEKTCGASQTERRQLEPCWLMDGTGTPIKDGWNLIGAMHLGQLQLPLGNDGEPRKLDGHYVEQFLKRQPEWKEMKEKCSSRGEWLRSYSFRDTYSLRCHRNGIELGAICSAMGHNIEAHGRNYRWESERTTSAAFAAAFADVV